LPLWRQHLPALATALAGVDSDPLEKMRAIAADVAKKIPEEIPGIDRIVGWEHSLVAALENLAVLRRSFAIDPADRFIELLRHRFMSEVTEAARYLGVYRLANLDSFFRRLERSLEEQSGDVQAVLRMLRRSVAEIEEAEQALPEGATESGVQVMTIHKAKGLEFEHVYLAQLHARGKSSEFPDIRFDRRWLPGETAQYTLFGSPTLGFDAILTRDHQIDTAERIRTLYVAMTRAKERLVMIGNWPAAPVRSPGGTQVTYVDLLGQRETLPTSLEALLNDCIEDDRSYVDLEATRWRFPNLEDNYQSDSSSGEAGSPHLRTSQPALDAPALDTESLRQLRIDAEQRMQLPFSATASGEATRHLELQLDEPSKQTGPSRNNEAITAAGIGRLVGTSFHRMMETWRLGADPSVELERQRAIQIDWLTRNSSPSQLRSATRHLEALLERFHGGQIWSRFIDSAPNVHAREHPVVLPPAHSVQQPTGFVSGSIDLILRDSTRNQLVVVDYKTDQVEDDQELEQRASAYAHQESIYARAVAESLNLEQLPVCQLWFIWPDRLWEN
jgi:ATP-dependent exoDNAse (exonuclease V) beta subunit